MFSFDRAGYTNEYHVQLYFFDFLWRFKLFSNFLDIHSFSHHQNIWLSGKTILKSQKTQSSYKTLVESLGGRLKKF